MLREVNKRKVVVYILSVLRSDRVVAREDERINRALVSRHVPGFSWLTASTWPASSMAGGGSV